MEPDYGCPDGWVGGWWVGGTGLACGEHARAKEQGLRVGIGHATVAMLTSRNHDNVDGT